MLCSAKELALAEDAEGLLILPADAPVGLFSNSPPWRLRASASAFSFPLPKSPIHSCSNFLFYLSFQSLNR